MNTCLDERDRCLRILKGCLPSRDEQEGVDEVIRRAESNPEGLEFYTSHFDLKDLKHYNCYQVNWMGAIARRIKSDMRVLGETTISDFVSGFLGSFYRAYYIYKYPNMVREKKLGE